MHPLPIHRRFWNFITLPVRKYSCTLMNKWNNHNKYEWMANKYNYESLSKHGIMNSTSCLCLFPIRSARTGDHDTIKSPRTVKLPSHIIDQTEISRVDKILREGQTLSFLSSFCVQSRKYFHSEIFFVEYKLGSTRQMTGIPTADQIQTTGHGLRTTEEHTDLFAGNIQFTIIYKHL